MKLSVKRAAPGAIDLAARRIEFIASNERRDEDGEEILVAGWDLEDYRRNPVFLWAHDWGAPPIGRAERIEVMGKELRATIRFATAEEYPFAETVFRLYAGGFLSAVSVGFYPEDRQSLPDGGTKITAARLKEISAVPVPANPDALVAARAARIDTAPWEAALRAALPSARPHERSIMTKALSKAAKAPPQAPAAKAARGAPFETSPGGVEGETPHAHAFALGETMTGETNGHAHAIAYEGGRAVIQPAEGHTHDAPPEAMLDAEEEPPEVEIELEGAAKSAKPSPAFDQNALNAAVARAVEARMKALAGKPPAPPAKKENDMAAPLTAETLAAAMEAAITKALASAQPVASAHILAAPALSKSFRQPASTFGAYVAMLKQGRNDPARASIFAEETYGKNAAVTKALTSAASGGASEFVPQIVADEIIPALRAASVVRRFGPRFYPNPSGSLRIPRIATGVVGTWVGEDASASATKPTTDAVTLLWRKLHIKVWNTEELFMFSNPDAEAAITADIVEGAATTEDLAFIRGATGGSNPVGVRYQTDAANIFAANATVNAVNIEADLQKAINTLEAAHIPVGPDNTVWWMPSRSKNALAVLRDANGAKIYPEISAAEPRLLGYRVGVTNNIPTNLGAGTDSEIYLAHMPSIVIADGPGLSVEVLENATAKNEAGALKSGIDDDAILIKAKARTDIAMRYAKGAVVMTGVKF